jgi:hypothetical protein
MPPAQNADPTAALIAAVLPLTLGTRSL